MSAGTPLSSEIFNAREELVTSDLNRLQALASREVQDIAGQENTTDDSRAGSDPQNGVGIPISAAELLPSMSFPGGFAMTLGYGSAWMLDFGVGNFGDANNGSPYVVTRWAQQDLTFTTPDAGLPRIDLVVATPATVPTDSAVRFVVVDPIARSINPATMNKSSNPLASVQVIAGTPDPQPTAPAVPAGALALFEVYVPAGAANAAAFKLCRRVQRRSVGVMSTYHGVLRNCVPTWSLVDETTTASVLTMDGAAVSNVNRAAIDGEIVTFTDLGGGSTLPAVVADAGAASPFAAPAPSTNDQPYYIYLCGGRNLPQARLNPGGTALQPVCIVESLTPPTRDGRPSADITTPRGTTTEGALFVGVGYTVMGTTRRKGCHVQGDWVRPLTGTTTGFSANLVAFNEPGNRLSSLSATVRTLQPVLSKPNLPGSRGLLTAVMITDGSTSVQLELGQAIGATGIATEGFLYAPSGGTPVIKVDFEARAPGVPGAVYASPAAISDITGFLLFARGWSMGVPRLSE